MDHLEKLEKCLKTKKSTPGTYFSEDCHDQYQIGFSEFLKINDDEIPVVKDAIIRLFTEQVQVKGDHATLRACSMGCGGGSLDKLILDEVLKKYPDISIEFVGVEINETVYNDALRQIVFSDDRVKVTLYNQDFLLDIPEQPFDIMLAVHSLYHIESCLEGIKKLTLMTAENGIMFMSASREGYIYKPRHIIQKITKMSDPILSSSISVALKEVNMPFTVVTGFTTNTDLTQAIENDFATMEQQCLLSFLTRYRIENCDDSVRHCLINYFKEIARGKPEKYLVEVQVDYYTVHKSKT